MQPTLRAMRATALSILETWPQSMVSCRATAQNFAQLCAAWAPDQLFEW